MSNFLYLNTENIPSLPKSITTSKVDRDKIKTSIAHIGINNFHRAHQAYYIHELIEKHNEMNFGICGIDLLESDRKLYNILKDQDGLYTLLIKNSNGKHETKVIGSIVEYFYGPENPMATIERIAQPDIKIISLTIAEDGYHLNEITGEFNMKHPEVEEDSLNKFNPRTVFGYLIQVFNLRKKRDLPGYTILSCDNIQSNGDTIKSSFLKYVNKTDSSLLPWLEENISFPNSMVDRITTVTSPIDIEKVKNEHATYDQWPVVCESFSNWIIEDNFMFDKPVWEKVGVQFVKDIAPFENMKLRILNAGHSILGIIGTLSGHTSVHEVANNEDCIVFLENYINNEVTPNIENTETQSISTYKNQVVSRFKNPFINDKLSRICKESSTKIPIFIFPTLTEQLKNKKTIEHSAFVIAAWCKYYDGVDDFKNPFDILDSSSNQLIRTAALSHQNPELFLENNDIFKNLVNHKSFKERFTYYLSKLRSLPIKECLVLMNEKKL
ncbi:mannitol dehydrogenase family protein [Cellulophaga sp. HaHaR_3_176]|uniref:mannitol dehydrogenase family protein n=1 Tax=Cellulophaga sp. HaHaR_3_176 TaxID=1942464 RepID=UPI001C1FF912|nr:mannitol dehydrogenase family protein [Cellulophaga sp. HaHaR_3_176]QWX84518.1 mannitol dehydrogenase family protein [Cellulophaga sp. HaHaR_3_176]